MRSPNEPAGAAAPAAGTGPVDRYLAALHDEFRHLDDGRVADYIPELGKADPGWFGICLVTADGHVYEVGDSRQPFTIQSISKPFVLGMALEDRGRDAVLARIGVEPSGNPFNAIVVDEASNRPYNPMVNSGAIVATGLIEGPSVSERHERVLERFGRYVGHEVAIDDAVFDSERLTGDRNRAIGYLMRGFGMLEGDCEETLDLYFRQCSLTVTCRDVATMGATLANQGVNPVTGRRALDEQYVPDVLSVMSSCGMYDYSGEWVYRVGIPAKSGVSGGIVGILPGQLAIAVFSPQLDAQGNSVRGVRVCERISHDLSLHVLRVHSGIGEVIRRSYRGAAARSNRMRSAAEIDALDAADGAVVVHELQGDLYFASMEAAFRRIATDVAGVRFVVLDLRRVANSDPTARSLLGALATTLAEDGVELLLVAAADAGGIDGSRAFVDVDGALEWCEEQLIGTLPGLTLTDRVDLADQPLLRDLPAPALAGLERLVAVTTVPAGEVVVREGTPADALYFVLSGVVSVGLELGDGRAHRRLASFGAGMAFGETALVAEGIRTATVVTDEPTTLARLTLTDLDALAADHPDLMVTLYANLARQLATWLARANAQVRALEQ
ncbi:MAG: glutaminase A [Acidimicrobiia bacterium]